MANDKWEDHKSDIERLYIDEDKTLRDVMKYMSSKGFPKTKSQLEKQIKKWGFRKNKMLPRGIDWAVIGKRVEKRKRIQGKETEVVIDGELYPPEKLRKAQYGKAFVSTYDKLSSALDAPSPATPDGVVFQTPSSPHSDVPFQQHFAGLRPIRSPSVPWLRFAGIMRGQNQAHAASLLQNVSS
ncbi:Clr5 domain-containing protein [Aspergillus multicolor]|uniref:Clr5 domain-containing protein n=1 Tax=Aspergillus multicolor TaxID=41759 RepID=UPI003CCC923C